MRETDWLAARIAREKSFGLLGGVMYPAPDAFDDIRIVGHFVKTPVSLKQSCPRSLVFGCWWFDLNGRHERSRRPFDCW